MSRRSSCEICDPDSSSRRLCDACRADPANVDWVEGRQEEPDEHIEMRLAEAELLRSAWDRRPLRITPTVLRIAQLVAGGGETTERCIRRDNRGRRRGTYQRRKRQLSQRDIARIVGRSVAYVNKVIKRLES